MTATQVLTAGPESRSIHHQIVIVGGGAAGLTVAAQLADRDSALDILILDPSESHYYQPAWTLVGAGCYRYEDTVKPTKSVIPAGVQWRQDGVVSFDPEADRLQTQHGATITYEILIVCPGIQLDWDKVVGLKEALGKDGVCSNYAVGGANYTWELLNDFKGGNALFTFPATPIKCAGAPQKIMYLADDIFRRNGVRSQTNLSYCTAGPKIFAIETFVPPLTQVLERKNIAMKPKHNLKEVRAQAKEAIFEVATADGTDTVTLPYDILHVAPPMSAPDFIKNSPLAIAGPGGWVDVHKHTLQHNRYPNVFSLGDASSLPTSKTAAAIRKEAPVLVQNLLDYLSKKPLEARYNGYSCCPLITGFGKTILAEFDYDGKPEPSFPLDPTQERYSMWILKRHVLPWVYWNRMLKGKQHEGEPIRKWLRA
ncbi:FAD-dependent oxidoreductase [Altericista sp. CCNU0014]|uniref:NAD(P)/FAD-dependent oxidoreductase n=1 Tax=Altericista sp. CCNU0014 TaxID=3082949 RepID=UPI00384CC089